MTPKRNPARTRVSHKADAIRLLIERHAAADDPRVAAEASLPKAIREHHDLRRFVIVGRRERTALCDARAEEIEERSAHLQRRDLFRVALARIVAAAAR